MKKIIWFVAILAVWTLGFCLAGSNHNKDSYSPLRKDQFTQPVPPPPKPQPTDPELIDVQVPIPKEMRVYNKSGSQCCFCSLQVLANFHHIEQLYNITDDHKGTSGASELASVLNKRGVKFKQIERKDLSFVKEYVTEKKYGLLVGVYGTHAINLVHYDPEKKIVKVIDNSDRSLRIQTWTENQFVSRWDGWALTLFPPVEVNEITKSNNRIAVLPK